MHPVSGARPIKISSHSFAMPLSLPLFSTASSTKTTVGTDMYTNSPLHCGGKITIGSLVFHSESFMCAFVPSSPVCLPLGSISILIATITQHEKVGPERGVVRWQCHQHQQHKYGFLVGTTSPLPSHSTCREPFLLVIPLRELKRLSTV